jgi:hypothetical protein
MWRQAMKAAQPTAANRFARAEVAPRPVVPPDLIEIALSVDTTVRIAARIDPRALRYVLAADDHPVIGAQVSLPCGSNDLRKGMDGLAETRSHTRSRQVIQGRLSPTR